MRITKGCMTRFKRQYVEGHTTISLEEREQLDVVTDCERGAIIISYLRYNAEQEAMAFQRSRGIKYIAA